LADWARHIIGPSRHKLKELSHRGGTYRVYLKFGEFLFDCTPFLLPAKGLGNPCAGGGHIATLCLYRIVDRPHPPENPGCFYTALTIRQSNQLLPKNIPSVYSGTHPINKGLQRVSLLGSTNRGFRSLFTQGKTSS
jgi:hypothetical protein